MWKVTRERFIQQLENKVPSHSIVESSPAALPLHININVKSNDLNLVINVDESYKLTSSIANQSLIINVVAETIFGARHAIETLVQLILYDDVSQQLFVRQFVEINDKPVYYHRGISLDTARNYFSVPAILKAIGKNHKPQLYFHQIIVLIFKLSRRNGNGKIKCIPLAHHRFA